MAPKNTASRTAGFALVTGASSGSGRATARALGALGWRLRIVGRTPKKLDAAVDELRRGGAEVESFRADFSSLEQVRNLASEVLARDEPLNVLINNAGVWHPEFRLSSDGHEDTFAVNHLAPFLLTHLLLPRLRETPGDRRIVHVSSRLHRQAGTTQTRLGRAVHIANVMGIPARGPAARFEFDAIDQQAGYRGLEAYARSKLAQVIISGEFARREQASGVTSNAVHPGSVYTDVARDNRVLSWLNPLAKPFLKSPEQGARTSVHVATARELVGVSGKYFANERPAAEAGIVTDADVARRLWTLSEQLTSPDR
ncbi:MAG: retinol dehydrogenase-14 [Myxococcota bacterium]|jgi:retinol dehydrogenase-14